MIMPSWGSVLYPHIQYGFQLYRTLFYSLIIFFSNQSNCSILENNYLYQILLIYCLGFYAASAVFEICNGSFYWKVLFSLPSLLTKIQKNCLLCFKEVDMALSVQKFFNIKLIHCSSYLTHQRDLLTTVRTQLSVETVQNTQDALKYLYIKR